MRRGLPLHQSERRLRLDPAVTLSSDDRQFSLSALQFRLDHTALAGIENIEQLSAQFLDMLFDGHRVIS